jgi:phage tail-like protein
MASPSKSGGSATSFSMFSGIPENHMSAYVPPEYKTFSNSLTDFSAPPISTVGAGLVAGDAGGPAAPVTGGAGPSPVQIDDSGRYMAYDMKVMEQRMTAYQAPELLSGEGIKAKDSVIVAPPVGIAAATVTTADGSRAQPGPGIGPGEGLVAAAAITTADDSKIQPEGGEAGKTTEAVKLKQPNAKPKTWMTPELQELLLETSKYEQDDLNQAEAEATAYVPPTLAIVTGKGGERSKEIKKHIVGTVSPISSSKDISPPQAHLPSMMSDSHYGGFRFRVFIEGITVDRINDAFTKISGLTSESEDIPFMHGTDPYVYLAPGRSKFQAVEFERVYNGIDSFYRWRREIETGTFDDEQRVVVRVEVLNSKSEVLRTMVLVNAWPIKWEMPDLDAGTSGPAIEKFSLVCKEIYEE